MSRQTSTSRRWASMAEAAEYIGGGISERTIQRWIAAGRLTAYRAGPRLVRVDLTEIDTRVLRRIPAAQSPA